MHEDQFLNFLVNRLDEEVSLDLANNAELNAEDIYEVLVGATVDGILNSTLCNSSEASPSANVILYHLRTKLGQNGSNESLTRCFDKISSNDSLSRWRSVQTPT